MAVNKAIILGFLGQDPKIDTLNTGVKVASFSVATTEKGYTAQNGTQVPDKTEWHNVIAWGKLADIAGNWLKKGSRVYLEGKMRTRSYDDKNGVKRYVTEIQAENIQLIDSKQSANNNQQPQPEAQPASGNDDLPF